MNPVRLTLGRQSLDLLPERVAFWHEEHALLMADCHFGKAATFRHHGLAVPEGGTVDDLDRLDSLIARTGARRLIVVGDLFHAPTGYSPDVVDELMSWRRRNARLRLTLIPGNHDRALHRLPAALELEVPQCPHEEAGLGFIHDPAELTDPPESAATAACGHVCGHLHPAVRLGDRRVRGLSAPCFWLRGGSVLVLPSFGSFTGSAVISPVPGDRVFAVTAGRILEVPEVLLGV